MRASSSSPWTSTASLQGFEAAISVQDSAFLWNFGARFNAVLSFAITVGGSSDTMIPLSVQWPDKVEDYVARFIGSPLTYDTVMLRPSYRDGKIDKEVCDVLFALRGQGIVLALKSQHEEAQRDIVRVHGWCANNAREAVRALNGATRTIASRSFSCRHPRRGLVTFESGAVLARHAVAVLEVRDECVILPNDLPDRTKGGVPLTYLSTNDFLNI